MKLPQRWVIAMTYAQVRAAWHGTYCERVRDYLERAAVMRGQGDMDGARQLMRYARFDAASARYEYDQLIDDNKETV